MPPDLPMFAPPAVEAETRADGSVVVRSAHRLQPYPASLGARLRHWAREHPDRPFLAERDGAGWRTIGYAAALAEVRRVASGLLALGLDRTTPVAILSEASIAHATLALAALDAGIPVAPISPAYSTGAHDLRRLAFVLAALRPRAVFADDGDRYRAALDAVAPGVTPIVERGAEPRRGALRLGALGSAAHAAAAEAAHAAVGPDDVAKILFTSGSTGEPKGVINTHRMLCSNQQSLAQAWPFLAAHDLVLVDWLPWHHTFGGNHNFNMALYHGGTLVIDDGRPVPERFARTLDALATHPPTVYFNVPRGHRLVADALAAEPAFAARFFSRLRLIGNAAAALPASTWDALRAPAERYGGGEVAIAGLWGLTETAPMATLVHYALHDPADIGVPGPGTELKFVDVDGKREARVRGPNVTPGYWGRDDLTAAAFDEEGFYRTGDALRFADPRDPARGLLFDGRLAENFKLSSGTWVDAGAVRLGVLAALGALIDDLVVAGENGDEIGLLLVVNARARERYPHGDDLRRALAAQLAAYNATAGGSSSAIGRALVLAQPLSPEDGEITDKGSVNRRRVLTLRAAAVHRLFAPHPEPEVIVPARVVGDDGLEPPTLSV